MGDILLLDMRHLLLLPLLVASSLVAMPAHSGLGTASPNQKFYL